MEQGHDQRLRYARGPRSTVIAFIVVAMVGALLPLGPPSPAAADFPTPTNPWVPDHDRWMGELGSQISGRSLVTLPIPATHQSQAYDLSTDIAPDAPFEVPNLEQEIGTLRAQLVAYDPATACEADDPVLSVLCGVVNDLLDLAKDAWIEILDGLLSIATAGDAAAAEVIGQQTARWGLNQSRNIATQLSDGIRGLDFRVCLRPGSEPVLERMYGCHSVYSNQPLTKDLADLRTFLAAPERQQEVVVLKIRTVGEWSDADQQALAAEIDRFGAALIPDATALTTPLSDLWAASQQLLVLDTGGTLAARSTSIRPAGSSVLSSYLETESGPELRTHLHSSLRGRHEVQVDDMGTTDPSDDTTTLVTDPTQIFDLETQLTPLNDTITTGVIASFVGAQSEEIQDLLWPLVRDGLGVDASTPLGVPWGQLSVGQADAFVRDSFEFGLRPALLSSALNATSRANVNMVSVDHYDITSGFGRAPDLSLPRTHFVDSMIAIALDDEPPLQVAGAGPNDPDVLWSELPAGLIPTATNGDLSVATRLVAGPEDNELTGIDVTAVPGQPRVVASTFHQNPDSEATDARFSVVHVPPRSGSGPSVEFGFPIDDAVGPPAAALHDGRIWLAYPAADDSLAASPDVGAIRVRAARIPADWNTLLPDDFDIDVIVEENFDEPQPVVAGLERTIDLTSTAQGLEVTRLEPSEGGYRLQSGRLNVELVDGRSFGVLTSSTLSEPFNNRPDGPVGAAAVGTGLAIAFGQRVWTGVAGQTLTPVPDAVPSSSTPIVAVGEWQGQVLVAQSYFGSIWARTVDPATGAVSGYRKVSSSGPAVALSTPVANDAPKRHPPGPASCARPPRIRVAARSSTRSSPPACCPSTRTCSPRRR